MLDWQDRELVLLGLIGGFGVLLVVALIWIGVLSGRLNRLQDAYRKLVGDTGVRNLEDVLAIIHERLAAMDRNVETQRERLSQCERRLATLKGHVGVHRFNAFADTGSDLSFSLAMVDDAANGVVLTGIYGRDQTYLYAKPLEKGESSYALTPEERAAIRLATQKE
jgi:hypothetical protein